MKRLRAVKAWAVIDPEGEPLPFTCSDLINVVKQSVKDWKASGWKYTLGRVEIRPLTPKPTRRKKCVRTVTDHITYVNALKKNKHYHEDYHRRKK